MARVRKALTATALGAAAFALIAAAAGTTGAYFSETADGGITGNIGAVHLSTSNTTIAWANMMPGEPKTATVDFRNKGTGNQDFYVVFPNGPALHALNNLGGYGEVHVTGGKTGNIVALFDSANLQDGRTLANLGNSCSGSTPTGCWPLPSKLKIAGNVAPDATGSFSFTFAYDGRLGEGTSGGVGLFNAYPSITTLATPGSQAFGADAAGPSGNGLPFKVVAVQVGQQP
jgi:hypothetical protein